MNDLNISTPLFDVSTHYIFRKSTLGSSLYQEVVVTVWQGSEETMITPENGEAYFETIFASRARARRLMDAGYVLVRE